MDESLPAKARAERVWTSARPYGMESAQPWISTPIRALRCESALECREIHGLDQMYIEAGISRALAILRLAVAGESDEANILELRHRPQPSREGEAVHLRQTQIKERHVRLKALDILESLPSVESHMRLVALKAQERGE
jgi:hypothetical protein